MNPYYSPGLHRLNVEEINWNAPEESPCSACLEELAAEPVGGSYATTLRHFESVLGELPDKIPNLRCLIVFNDPRDPRVKKFDACPPSANPGQIDPSTHRYFCLSRFAWRELGLNQIEESPAWPTRESATAFLDPYIRYASYQPWCYDAFLAYVLWRLRPGMAYITNLTKCHFGSAHRNVKRRAQAICVARHLSREIRLLNPNLVIAFASEKRTIERQAGVSFGTKVQFARLPHFAAPGLHLRPPVKARAFLDGIGTARGLLTSLGEDGNRIYSRIAADVEACVRASQQ